MYTRISRVPVGALSSFGPAKVVCDTQEEGEECERDPGRESVLPDSFTGKVICPQVWKVPRMLCILNCPRHEGSRRDNEGKPMVANKTHTHTHGKIHFNNNMLIRRSEILFLRHTISNQLGVYALLTFWMASRNCFVLLDGYYCEDIESSWYVDIYKALATLAMVMAPNKSLPLLDLAGYYCEDI